MDAPIELEGFPIENIPLDMGSLFLKPHLLLSARTKV
jgi:hypothetical protein